MTVIDELIKSIKSASRYNKNEEARPKCILWTDKNKEWVECIPSIQQKVPELFVYGDYDKANKTGPAIWLRCVLANLIDEYKVEGETIPIIYLPGINKSDLRADGQGFNLLKPLVWLQFIGAFWLQANSKDWTIFAFLTSVNGGLNLRIAEDKSTKELLKKAMPILLNQKIKSLSKQEINKNYLNNLLIPDINKSILEYLNNSGALPYDPNLPETHAFIQECESTYKFNPDQNGVIFAAEKLCQRKGEWRNIWNRYCEAPDSYPKVYNILNNFTSSDILWKAHTSNELFGGYPQWNELQENIVNTKLEDLDQKSEDEVRAIIIALEKDHRERRSLPWTKLGFSPLAQALEHLAIIADLTKNKLDKGSIENLAKQYDKFGWKIDDAVIKALSCTKDSKIKKIISRVINLIYKPWLENSALYLQRIVSKDHNIYPFISTVNLDKTYPNKNTCVLFVDGLRYDLAKNLEMLLKNNNCNVSPKQVWAALPTVTATGKPAVSPIAQHLNGSKKNNINDFEIIDSSKFKALLKKSDWRILNDVNVTDNNQNIWCEFGDIDSLGHNEGAKFIDIIDNKLQEICSKVKDFLNSGTTEVRIVTDHGWLFMPNGLPKVELNINLTESKWSRVASIKSNSTTEERLYPWFWDSKVCYSLANGIACYKNNEEYAHGGLSLQECLNLELTVTLDQSKIAIKPKIDFMKWKGLRCNIKLADVKENLTVKIISNQLTEPETLYAKPKSIDENGSVSLVIEDEDFDGQEAIIIICDQNKILCKKNIIIGKNE